MGRGARQRGADAHVRRPPRPASLYTSLAPWFHLITAPADYAEEAAFVLATTFYSATRFPIEPLYGDH